MFSLISVSVYVKSQRWSTMKSRLAIFNLCSLVIALVGSTLSADEGMWLFNDLPKAQLKSKYGFEPTDEPVCSRRREHCRRRSHRVAGSGWTLTGGAASDAVDAAASGRTCVLTGAACS